MQKFHSMTVIKNKIKRFINSYIIAPINNTLLCISFPFLYPRNRFTGLHYNNWEINKFLTNSRKLAYTNVRVHIVNESKLPEIKSVYCNSDIIIMPNKKTLIVLNNKHKTVRIDISKYCNGEISYIRKELSKENEINVYAVVKDGIEIAPHFITETFITDKIMYFILKVMEWFYHHPLQWIHCIPMYTELDALDNGWRLKFGKQLCKDIKKSLLKEGGRRRLKDYRILQIKEKWGRLCWYACGDTFEIMEKIIPKYEELSYHTCINCGKPATKRSTGWICPYCDDCIGDRDYIDIK